MKKTLSVEQYIEVNAHFSDALVILRNIINSTELEETIKWSMPTYCLNGKNVLGIGAFKHHFCLWFHNGVFLKDKDNLLINAQENNTKALRQMRFETKADINETVVLAYVKEAIENQRLGKALKKPQHKTKPIVIPKELKKALNLNTKLNIAFHKLSPSHQREYCEYIAEAKRENTKERRINKIIPMILGANGLNDAYKK